MYQATAIVTAQREAVPGLFVDRSGPHNRRVLNVCTDTLNGARRQIEEFAELTSELGTRRLTVLGADNNGRRCPKLAELARLVRSEAASV